VAEIEARDPQAKNLSRCHLEPRRDLLESQNLIAALIVGRMLSPLKA